MTHAATIDFDKYRLRSFVERLIELGEVEIHERPVPLTGLSPIIERTDKAVLFKKAGPEQVELVAKTAGNRKRLWSRCRPATRRCMTSKSPARTSI
jgi:2,5-furandicarboxylate decarboxylase 1